jgi:hypothetical protein
MPRGLLFGHSGDLRGTHWEHFGNKLKTHWERLGVMPQKQNPCELKATQAAKKLFIF